MNPLYKPSGKTACQPLLIGSHVGMSGTSMMDGSVQEALSYGANTFMLYTGAPQNTPDVNRWMSSAFHRHRNGCARTILPASSSTPLISSISPIP